MHPPVLLKLLAFALPLFEQADDLTRSLRQYHNAFVLPFGGFRGFSVHGLTRRCQPTGWNAEVISKFPPIFSRSEAEREIEARSRTKVRHKRSRRRHLARKLQAVCELSSAGW
jgi:hypothetical protein